MSNLVKTESVAPILGLYRLSLAIMVFLAHRSGVFKMVPGAAGLIGVIAFFMVSGYVIIAAVEVFYVNRIRDFMVNRFLRIYPMFWACYLFSVFSLLFVGVDKVESPLSPQIAIEDMEVINYVASLSIIGAWVKGSSINPLTPMWTLIVEMQFYVAVSFICIAKCGKKYMYISLK